MKRRDFLKSVGGTVAGGVAFAGFWEDHQCRAGQLGSELRSSGPAAAAVAQEYLARCAAGCLVL